MIAFLILTHSLICLVAGFIVGRITAELKHWKEHRESLRK